MCESHTWPWCPEIPYWDDCHACEIEAIEQCRMRGILGTDPIAWGAHDGARAVSDAPIPQHWRRREA